MVGTFSTPILSVAADAVRDLEGHDALFGLWTIFTKCKESVPNGARLENITWRLWHRELKGAVLEKASQITDECNAVEAIGLPEKSSYQPPTPSASSPCSSPSEDVLLSFSEVHSPPFYSLSHPPTRPAVSLSKNVVQLSPSRRISGSLRGVGRIICDFLPGSNTSMDQPSSLIDVSSGLAEGAATTHQSHTKTALVACDAVHVRLPKRSLGSCRTPDGEEEELDASITRTATQSPSPLLNSIPDAESTSGLLSAPPKLVLVNPTPSPTPHPTPPTTPLVTSAPKAMHGRKSLWLTPHLPRSSVSQTETEETAVGGSVVIFSQRGNGPPAIPLQSNIWTLPTADHDFGQDLADNLSVSSIASKSSECSLTTMSVAGASTTSVSSTGYLPDEGEKAIDLIGNTMGYRHLVGNLPLTTLQMDSLTTIQSISTDRGRKQAVTSSDIGDAPNDNGVVPSVEDDSHTTFASKRRTKKNTAPVSLTSTPAHPTYPHVDLLHQSPTVALTTELPLTSESSSKTETNSKSLMNPEAGNNRHPSQSRSEDGSANESRSRSPERSGNPFADLSGIGTLGGYTIAAAYPPPNMTVRKQVVVGAGKGKVKVTLGRNAKSKSVRRNSAGSAVDVGVKEKDKGVQRCAAKLGSAKSVEHQPSLEDILEKSTLGQQDIDQPQDLVLIREEDIPKDSTTTAPSKHQNSAMASTQFAELTTEPSFLRQPTFNIGSNSDDGGSKSGSSLSGGHSLAQCAGKMMENIQGRRGACLNESLDAQVLEKREGQPPMTAAKDVRQPEVQLRKIHADPLQPTILLRESGHSKTTLHQLHTRHASETRADLERIQSSDRIFEKARGTKHNHHAVPAATSNQSSKTKSKSTPNLGSLDPVLAAKIRDSLGEPLLPKGRPVVVDTESEYETDTEDGSWSDEEVIDETEVKREFALQQERERQEAERQQEELLRQMYIQQQQRQQQHVSRPTGVQRTHSSHYPAPNNARAANKGAQRSRNQHRDLAANHAKLEQAAKEAQRQRDMIKKLPRESFQDLAKARANSVGLLSQLLNPNPPLNHPYSRGDSSGAIHPIVPALINSMQPTTSDPGPSANPHAVEKLPPNDNPQLTQAPPVRRRGTADEGKRRMSLTKITSPMRGPPLQVTKSFAALPVSSQVQVGSVSTRGGPSAALSSAGAMGKNSTTTGSGGRRPKGPPIGQEMEEDSDSEPETGKIQISKSIAEQKLKALAEKRGIRRQAAVQPSKAGPSKVALPGDEDVPDWARVSQPDRQQERFRPTVNGLQDMPVSHPPPSAPIPLGLPYNLLQPAPPTTPRTTRRQMLSTELSESLRRNLLWERQVSKNLAMQRSSSGIANGHDGLRRLQPFTSIAPVVQLHAKGTIPLDQQEDPAKRVVAPMTEAEKAELRKYAVARNRSWANEFHYAGW